MSEQPLVSFRVIGDPKPQGSKSAFAAKGTGRVMTKETGGVGFAAWRNAVSEAAMRAREEFVPEPVLFDGFAVVDIPLDGPLRLVTRFQHRMPESRRKRDILPGGWAWKASAPDQSKMIRLVEDSLQAAGLIKDDARFAEHVSSKVETLEGWTGVQIEIYRCGLDRPVTT